MRSSRAPNGRHFRGHPSRPACRGGVISATDQQGERSCLLFYLLSSDATPRKRDKPPPSPAALPIQSIHPRKWAGQNSIEKVNIVGRRTSRYCGKDRREPSHRRRRLGTASKQRLPLE